MTITQQRLKEVLDYDPSTGVFVWKIRSDVKKEWNTKFAGKEAGWLTNGYRQISIDSENYLCHRLAILYVHGYLPDFVDHDNVQRGDNRLENLRPCTQSQNLANRGALNKNNTSGYRGVTFNKAARKFIAQIMVNRRGIRLGAFDDKFDAALAYDFNAGKIFGKFATLNFPDWEII